VDVAVAAETVVDEVVGVNATSISTRGMLASRGTTKTHGMAHMVEGDTTNLQIIPTLPQLKPRAIRTEGTRRKTITRTNNRADTGDHLSRHMTHGLRINNHPTEVAEEDTIPDMMARTAARRMGTLEGEEVRRTAAVGMAIKVVGEGVMGMVAAVVGTASPHRTVVTAEVATTEEEEAAAAVITLVEATNPVVVISPVDHTAPVSSLTGTKEGTIKEVEVAGEGTDHRHTDTYAKMPLRFVSSIYVFLLL